MSRPNSTARGSAGCCSRGSSRRRRRSASVRCSAVIGDSANTASIAVHAAVGFRLVGTFQSIGFKHGRWLDTVLMQRALGSGDTTPPSATFPRLLASGEPTGDDAERAVERAEHAVELLAAAQDMAGGRNHAIGALPAAEFWIFLDAVDRHFRGAAENRKHRAVLEEIDGVIAPLAGGDFAAVEPQNAVELAPAEGYLACGGGRPCSPPRYALGSISPISMRRLLVMVRVIGAS